MGDPCADRVGYPMGEGYADTGIGSTWPPAGPLGDCVASNAVYMANLLVRALAGGRCVAAGSGSGGQLRGGRGRQRWPTTTIWQLGPAVFIRPHTADYSMQRVSKVPEREILVIECRPDAASRRPLSAHYRRARLPGRGCHWPSQDAWPIAGTVSASAFLTRFPGPLLAYGRRGIPTVQRAPNDWPARCG